MFERAKRFESRRAGAENGFEGVLGIGVVEFGVREFPQVRVNDPGGPLPDKEFPIAFNDESNEATRGGGDTPAGVGQFSRTIFPESDAKFFYRANRALRLAWRANQSAKFHEGLVEERTGISLTQRRKGRKVFQESFSLRTWRLCVRNQFCRQLPKLRVGFLFPRIFCDAKNPCQHADDVAVENRRRLVERDAANRAGGVTADARQREHVIEIIREFAIVLFHDLPRRLLQIAGAGVIAKALPKLVDFVRAGTGRRLDGGQFAHPAFPIRQDRLDLRLLEHDFGYGKSVGVICVSPR